MVSENAPAGLQLGKSVFLLISAYLGLGIGVFLITPILLSNAHFEAVLIQEREFAHIAQWPVTLETPLVDSNAAYVAAEAFHYFPQPSTLTNSMAKETEKVLESVFKTNPGTWYGERIYPKVQTYLHLIGIRFQLTALFVALMAPFLMYFWHLGEAVARKDAKEGVMPAPHKFRWYALGFLTIILSVVTILFVPVVGMNWVTLVLVGGFSPWLVYKMRVHGIEI